MTHTNNQSTSKTVPLIYSVGYEHETSDTIGALLDDLGATLVDVRGSLHRCKSGFGPRQLEARFGDRYKWLGQTLGNRGENRVTAEGIDYLLKLDHPVILMCKEAAPGECHRHTEIAVRLLTHGVDVRHIYEDVIVLASDLQKAIDTDDGSDGGYKYTELESYKATILDLPVTQYDLEHASKTGELATAPDLAKSSG